MLKKTITLSIIALSAISITNIHAADNLDIDELLNDTTMENNNTTDKTTNNTTNEDDKTANETVDKTTSNENENSNEENKKLEVIQNWNEIEVKNWDADYLFVFEPKNNVKVNKDTVQVENNNENVDFIIEDSIKTYKNGDILEKWKQYMIELWWNFDEVRFILDNNLKPVKIVKKVNNSLDIMWVKAEYEFTDKKETEKVDTKLIKKKKPGIVENTIAVISLFMIMLYAFRKDENKI